MPAAFSGALKIPTRTPKRWSASTSVGGTAWVSGPAAVSDAAVPDGVAGGIRVRGFAAPGPARGPDDATRAPWSDGRSPKPNASPETKQTNPRTHTSPKSRRYSPSASMTFPARRSIWTNISSRRGGRPLAQEKVVVRGSVRLCDGRPLEENHLKASSRGYIRLKPRRTCSRPACSATNPSAPTKW